ncbi:unnamed protein product [Owenia fusiformis]|uniref:Uncharacterized protein n=1 Tax=Owenia fusiformis TaxID=6347 RepID=A0A8S4PTZ5_OWEFU|nr:unnamed protein product [Owenia fusiformis]
MNIFERSFLLSIFISNIVVTVNASCSKNKGPKNLTPTNYTVYKKTFTIIADGVRISSMPTLWPKSWQDFWEDTGSTAVIKGRDFINWAQERYGIDAYALTDEQLTNGEEVDLGGFVFRPYMPAPKELNFRLLTETTKRRVKFYRNTEVREAAFVLHINAEYNSTGTVKVTIPSGAVIFLGAYLIDTTKECGFNSNADIIIFTTKTYLQRIGGMAPLHFDTISNKYGVGELIGSSIASPSFFKESAVLFFPPTYNGP